MNNAFGPDPRDVEVLRKMTPSQRLERGLRFNEETRQFKAAALRIQHLGWTGDEMQRELARWTLRGRHAADLY